MKSTRKTSRKSRKRRETKQGIKSGLDVPDAQEQTEFPDMPSTLTPASINLGDNHHVLDRPSKRRKLTSAKPKSQVVDSSNSSLPGSRGANDNTAPQANAAAAVNVSERALAAELQHLRAKYDFVYMAIASGSKIEQKVRALLTHMSNFSLTDAAAKPGVASLHAKPGVNGKLTSIVELAKREISSKRGRWWQYTSVHGELHELKEKPPKRLHGKASSRSEMEGQPRDGSIVTASAVEKEQGAENEDSEMKEKTDAEEEEEGFETIVQGYAQGHTASAGVLEVRKKVRALPVMIIYLSRVPVPELKELYGEQTNS